MNKKKVLSLLLAVLMIFSILPTSAFADSSIDNRVDAMIIGSQAYQLKTVPNPGFGTSYGEWTVLGLNRSGANLPEGYNDGYYTKVVTELHKINQEKGFLEKFGIIDSNKPTENARLIVGLTSTGKDVSNVDGYNLLLGLSNMTFVKRQHGNGPSWALIALDSNNYEIPKNVLNNNEADQVTREKLVNELLNSIKPDGGWSFDGDSDVSDLDMTAMVIYSLAPYRSDPRVETAINNGLKLLSSRLPATADYGSSETIDQVIVALSALGRDATTDPMFVKGNNNLITALEKYYVPSSGGFKHVKDSNENAMATDQALYALSAYQRFKQGKNRLFDMTDAFTEEEVIVLDISVDTTNAKLNYVLGEEADFSGLKVFANMSDDSTMELTQAEYTLSSPNMTTPGQKAVLVTYEGFTKVFNITVEEQQVEPVEKSINIKTNPTKVEYALGDSFDPSGLEVELKYSDNTTKLLGKSEYTLSTPNMNTPGQKIIKVSYNNLETTFNITVGESEEPVEESINITSNPAKLDYEVGETFTPNGLKVVVKISNGQERLLSSSEYSLTSPDMSTPGIKTIQVSYKNFHSSFNITVKEKTSTPIEELAITVNSNFKKDYTVGEPIDFSGMVVTLIYTDGTSRILTRDEYFIEGATTNTPGFKDVIVSHKGLTTRFNINVTQKNVNPIRMTIESMPKTEYVLGDTLDLSNLILRVEFDDGTIKYLNQNDVNRSNVNLYVEGSQTLTLYYLNLTVDIPINIKGTTATGTQAYVSVTVPPGPTVYNGGWVMQEKKAFDIVPDSDTAYSILQRTGLNLRVNTHEVYAGIYVAAIEGLGEFDGGPLSGWMYRVNGWFPNYSSSLYKLKPGDYVEWIYTRDLGKDIGGYVDGIENDDGMGGKTYYVVASASEGGIIAPSGNVLVTTQKPVTFKLIPNEGYVILDLLLDGVSLGPVSEFTATVNNIKAKSTLEAVFKKTAELTEAEKVKIEEQKKQQQQQQQQQQPTTPVPNTIEKFTDIKCHWAYENIKYVFDKGYFRGISETEFGPDNKITRGMFVTVLGRMSGENIPEISSNFTDVNQNQYYSKYIKWASDREIVNGVGEGRFEPDREINREEMSKMISNYLKYKNVNLNNNTSVEILDESSISDWAKDHVKLMYSNGILQGRPDGRFYPKDPSTRAEVATIVYRIDNIK